MYFIVLQDETSFVKPTKLNVAKLKDYVKQIQQQSNVIGEEYGVCNSPILLFYKYVIINNSEVSKFYNENKCI